MAPLLLSYSIAIQNVLVARSSLPPGGPPLCGGVAGMRGPELCSGFTSASQPVAHPAARPGGTGSETCAQLT